MEELIRVMPSLFVLILWTSFVFAYTAGAYLAANKIIGRRFGFLIQCLFAASTFGFTITFLAFLIALFRFTKWLVPALFPVTYEIFFLVITLFVISAIAGGATLTGRIASWAEYRTALDRDNS